MVIDIVEVDLVVVVAAVPSIKVQIIVFKNASINNSSKDV